MTEDTCEKQPLSGTLAGVATPEIVDVAEPVVEDTLEGGADTTEGADQADTTAGGDTQEAGDFNFNELAANAEVAAAHSNGEDVGDSVTTLVSADETDTVTGAEDADTVAAADEAPAE